MARTATAAAVAGLAAAAAAWFGAGPGTGLRLPASAPGSILDQPAVVRWEQQATDAASVPDAVQRGASSIRIGVVDTGADVSTPMLFARRPQTYDVLTRRADVRDTYGHGTLVASIAAGAGGDAGLLIVKAADSSGRISPVSEAAAIRYAVTHGARILNLSFAGPTTSPIERAAVRFAVKRGALLVAAAGNAYGQGNPVEYPAALLQPVGSDGRGGSGLAVGASGLDGTRAPFSSSGSWISLAAPGEQVQGGNGTSFAAPQVAGAAALVWAANPSLSARQVAAILEQTASGHGTWTPDLGYGVLDIGAAVAAASAAETG